MPRKKNGISDSAQNTQVQQSGAGDKQNLIKTIINSLPGIFYLLDANGEFVMWNNVLSGLIKSESGKERAPNNALKSVHPDDRVFLKEAILDVMKGVENSIEVRILVRGGPEFRWFQLRGKKVVIDNDTYIIGLGTDITESKKSANYLIWSNRTLQLLGKCNEIILHACNEVELLDAICRIIVEIGGYRMVWVGYAEQDKAKSVSPVAHAGFDEGYRSRMKVSWANVDRGRGPTGIAIRKGKPSLTRNILNDPLFEPWRMDATQHGYTSVVGLPLKAGNKAFGAVTVYSSHPDAFDAMEMELLTTLVDNLAYAITVLRTREATRIGVENLRKSETRYRALFQNHHTVMLITDPEDGMIVDANPAAAIFYGWPIEQLRRMHVQDINSLSPAETMAGMEQSRSGEKNHFSFRHRRANASIRDVDVFSSKIEISGKTLLYSIIHDITERKRYETVTSFRFSLITMEATHSIGELLQMTLDVAERLTKSSISLFHFVAEDQTTLSLQAWSTNTKRNMCKATSETQHYPVDQVGVLADALRERKAFIHNDYASLQCRKGMPEAQTEVKREVVVPVLRDDKVVAIVGVGNKCTEYDEDDVKWVSTLADIAWDIVAKKIADKKNELLKEQNFVIEDLAMHDSLTGLPNRRLLSDRITQALAQGQRNRTMAALMLFDLDKFKMVNDTYGHYIGDLLLKEVASRTSEKLQRGGDSLARLSGDEFVVLLPHIAEISNAVATAEKILSSLKKPFEIEGHTINISCSMGIAVFPIHGRDELSLMKHADIAMYKSKRDGGNCITVFHDKLSLDANGVKLDQGAV